MEKQGRGRKLLGGARFPTIQELEGVSDDAVTSATHRAAPLAEVHVRNRHATPPRHPVMLPAAKLPCTAWHPHRFRSHSIARPQLDTARAPVPGGGLAPLCAQSQVRFTSRSPGGSLVTHMQPTSEPSHRGSATVEACPVHGGLKAMEGWRGGPSSGEQHG